MVASTKPTRLNAGDSASWVASLPAYPASSGWSLSFALVNSTASHPIAATALGDDFEVSISSSASIGYTPGVYTLIGYVAKGGERIQVSESRLDVFPDVTVAADRRTQAERTLAAIEDLLEGKADDDQQMIQYAGRTLSRYTFDQLEAIRSRLKRTVAREQARKAGHKGSIGVRF